MNRPLVKFGEWYALAQESAEKEPTAMSLATVDADSRPSVRIVLLKGFDESGFVFHTNENSKKGQNLLINSQAALCFFWPSIDKQVRIEGYVERTSEKESDEYFTTRPRLRQLGAWASEQSAPLAHPEELERRLHELKEKYGDRKIPRPPFWGGYRVLPRSIEFWSRGEHRLHHRELFYKKDGQWQSMLLFP
jgi:pyridoxamine 5'-phosphate oxidase